MDTSVMLGPLRFSLRATIAHHGPSVHSGHYTASINCRKIIPLQRHCICCTLWMDWVLDSNRRVGVWLLPWRWHILSIVLIAGRGMSVDGAFSPDDLCSRPETYIYIYMYAFFLSGYRTYIYRHRECRSILVKLHPITIYRTVLEECAVPVLNATRCLLWFHQLYLLVSSFLYVF